MNEKEMLALLEQLKQAYLQSKAALAASEKLLKSFEPPESSDDLH